MSATTHMIWKDLYNDADLWTGLRMEINQVNSGGFLLESGANCRFKLSRKERTIFWGTFGEEYWGVWILNNKVEWELNEMPIQPINSAVIEESKESNYYPFWSRFYARQLCKEDQSLLSKGLWTITIGSSWKDRQENTSEIIQDIDDAFDSENPRWLEWDIGGCDSLVALKDEPNEENGRVKWFRKHAREGTCPPVLVWYLGCVQGYVILDGHCRLKAFQLESIPPTFLVLNAIMEREVQRDPHVQQNILRGLEVRQKDPIKRKMNVDEVNKLLINAFDTRPYCCRITNAKARKGFEEQWMAEVRAYGMEQKLNLEDIEDMIQRIEL